MYKAEWSEKLTHAKEMKKRDRINENMFGKFSKKRSEKMALIILAGGKSSRMGGGDKALLPLGKETMVEVIISRLAPLFQEIIIVAKDAEPYNKLPVQVVHDQYPGFGPISGIHAGLQASCERVNFVIACDLPLIRAELVEMMLRRASEVDIVMPTIGKFFEPVAAVYCQRVGSLLEEMIIRGDFKLLNVVEKVPADLVREEELRQVDPELESFLNVNTPADYQKVQEILLRRREV